MKKISSVIIFLAIIAHTGCTKKDNYPGGMISPYIAIYDVKNLYRGQDVTLTRENMFGSTMITGLVVSDHSGNNLPEGLLVVQDYRRLGQLRGISIALGTAAANYQPGDSVIIDVEGGVLKRLNGILQITNLKPESVAKVSGGNTVLLNRVPANLILADPERFESVLSVIVKAGFNPLPAPSDVFAGDKTLNDGFGNISLHTEAAALFANDHLPVSANYYGIVFNKMITADSLAPVLRVRTAHDIVVLSSVIEIPPVIISGFMADVKGSDGNYEYIQLIATKDIDFAATPFSVVVTNNANASTPTGYPINGWGTGGMRTYKFNLTSGFAPKGTFFYVGGSARVINGPPVNGVPSTSMASSNWIRAFNYTTTNGDDFGTATGGLFANSGNASGIAVFDGTTVDASTKPVDVIFVSTGGSLYSAGPPAVGYRITNTDWYDIKNPITLEEQPFYRMGSNTLSLAYATSDQGYFNLLGGEYDLTLGKWTKARTQTNLLLEKSSPVSAIETDGATKIIF